MPRKASKEPLSGERLAWFELAYHLRMPVERLQAEITYSEFLEWQEFLVLERNKARKLDYYLAQIAAEVRRGMVKNPNEVKLSQFLLRFATKEEIDAASAEEYKAQRATLSMAAWFSLLGMDPEKLKGVGNG